MKVTYTYGLCLCVRIRPKAAGIVGGKLVLRSEAGEGINGPM